THLSGVVDAGRGHNQAQGRMIRLLIVDHAPTRTGIRLALGAAVEICAEADTAESAIRAAKHQQPDVALVGTGISAEWQSIVRGICRAAPVCAVVVLAELEDADDLIESVRAGAVGYVPGALDAECLRRVFHAVTQNEAAVPRALVGELLAELRTGAAAGDALTGREAQVLGMLRRGHSTARIAERLHIAPVTVRRHISELVRKVGVGNRSELMEQVPLDRRGIGQAAGHKEPAQLQGE
ncbi:MAG: response regulator transcription factor, partial [Solirubrobacteraceae bacterium]